MTRLLILVVAIFALLHLSQAVTLFNLVNLFHSEQKTFYAHRNNNNTFALASEVQPSSALQFWSPLSYGSAYNYSTASTFADTSNNYHYDGLYTLVAYGVNSTEKLTLYDSSWVPSIYGSQYGCFAVYNMIATNDFSFSISITTRNNQVTLGVSNSFVHCPYNETVTGIEVEYLGANSSTVIYVTNMPNIFTQVFIRGDPSSGYAFDHLYRQTDTSVYLATVPVAAPVSAPVAPSTPVAGPSSSSRLKFVNAMYDPDRRIPQSLTLYVNNTRRNFNSSAYSSDNANTTNIFGGTFTVTDVDQSAALVITEGAYPWSQTVRNVYLPSRRSLSYVQFYTDQFSTSEALLLDNIPPSYNTSSSYIRVINTLSTNNVTRIEYYYANGANDMYLGSGAVTPFVATQSIYFVVHTPHRSEGFSFNAGSRTATTIYLVGDSTYFYIIPDTEALPVPSQPICVNGFVESSGVCNCYSGYTNDWSTPYYLCTVAAPNYCFVNQTDDMNNNHIPYVNWWGTAVYGNTLYMEISSQMVVGRRTVVEMPNPLCNYVNRPDFYHKTTNGCGTDLLSINAPFGYCGFTLSESRDQQVYRGVVLVKQIDRVTVGGASYDRVIETPFRVVIRLPKTLAVQSSVTVYGPPSLAIDAAFVGQQVNSDHQSANLQYVSSVQYPLQIAEVSLVDLPWYVTAWVEIININCSDTGPCVQQLKIHVNTSSCSISGVYRLVVSLNCRSELGCPEEARNGTQVYLESNIVAQDLCGEVNIDIDLQGSIQAYNDPSFNNYALAFFPGQAAYFMIDAYSSRVTLGQVTLASVYYYGPNIPGQYLLTEGNASSLAVSSNFQSGSLGNNRAWFKVDVSVSTPNSGDNTLFKLYNGQNGVYNFIAFVDVEWTLTSAPSVQTPTSAPVFNAPTFVAPTSNTPVQAPVQAPVASPGVFKRNYFPTRSVTSKKRIVLQGSTSNQGSQFSAQVQIAGPTPMASTNNNPPPPTTTGSVSSSVALASSFALVVVLAVASLF